MLRVSEYVANDGFENPVLWGVEACGYLPKAGQ
jgi:hypothetical protein